MGYFRFGRIHVNQPLQLCEISWNFQKHLQNVQTRIRFPLDAQVEMAFVVEIMPIF